MRQHFSFISLIFCINLLFTLTVSSESSPEYVEKIHADIVKVVKEKQSVYIENPDEFIDAISSYLQPLVDFKRISRNVMGKHYKLATKDQIMRFTEIFERSLLRTYSKTLAEFKDEEIIVSPESKKSSKSKKEKVFLKIITSTKVYPATYDMYLNENGKWKLINIVINGVNLGLTFRNQFYSLMKTEDNDMDVVIDKWITSI